MKVRIFVFVAVVVLLLGIAGIVDRAYHMYQIKACSTIYSCVHWENSAYPSWSEAKYDQTEHYVRHVLAEGSAYLCIWLFGVFVTWRTFFKESYQKFFEENKGGKS